MSAKPRGSIKVTSPDSRETKKTPPDGGRCDRCFQKVSRYNPYKTRCHACVEVHGPPMSAQEKAWLLRQEESHDE